MKSRRTDDSTGKRFAAIVLAITLVIAVLTALAVAYSRLREIWLEQCLVRDVSEQVEVVTTGKMVKPDAILEAFGLRNGSNLALIDFNEKRLETLRRYPNIRSITISRHLPDRLTLSVIEREPFARIGFVGKKGDSGRVADSEGMVFVCRRGTGSLPLIREKDAHATVGKKLDGRLLAALTLIETARETQFSELNILEVDVSKPDFLLATLGNYSRAKIAWEGLDDARTAKSVKALRAQLDCLKSAIRSRLRPDAVIWNVTIPNRAYADNQGGF